MLPSLPSSLILSLPTTLPFPFPPKLHKSSLLPTTKKLAVSKKSPPATDELRRFLASYGFTDDLVERAVTRLPDLLVADRHKTLKPKLQFLLGDLGFSPEAIAASPYALKRSLHRRLRPNVAILAAALGSDDAAAAAVRKSPGLLCVDLGKHLLPKLEALRRCRGAPIERDVARLGIDLTGLLICTPEQLARTVEHLVEAGMDPASPRFVRAVAGLSSFKNSTLERKMDIYRSMGWSDEDIAAVVRNFPNCLQTSDEKTRRMVEYFKEELGWGPEVLAANPSVLGMSLEKRVAPRVAVWRVLQAKGLVRRDMRPIDLRISKERFWDKYVIEHGQECPEVLHAYRGAAEVVHEDEEDLTRNSIG